MKKYRWQILIFVIALIAIAVLLLGQDEPISEIIPEILDIPEEEQPSIYTEALVGEIVRLNPLMDAANQVDKDIDRLIYSSLIKFDFRGNPQPDLVEEWGISYDGLTYNIAMKQEAYWHDGEQVTTADVVFTIEQLRKQEFGLPEDIRQLWEGIEVTIYDDFNLKLQLEYPFAPFLDYLCFGVLPEHLYGSLSPIDLITSQLNLAPIGSGPYKFDALTTADGQITGVVLTAFEDHYGGRPLIDMIEFKLYPNFDTAWSAYQNEDVMGIGEIPLEAMDVTSAAIDLDLYKTTLPNVVSVIFNHSNNEKSFLQNAEVRKALMMGINQDYLISQMMQNEAVKVNSPILPGTWAHFDGLEKFNFDPAGAIGTIVSQEYIIPADGGEIRYLEEEAMTLTLLHENNPLMTAIAERIQDYWTALGVGVSLEPVSLTEMLTMRFPERTFDAALVTYNFSNTPDPDPYPFWHESQVISGQNYSGWADRRASEYLETARMSTIRTERERLYKNFQIHFNREVPALLLFQPVYTFGVSPEVAGISVGPMFDPSDRFNDIGSWYLISDEIMETDTPLETTE